MVDVARHRTFVLDTSVLLADPHALRRFDEHEVVLPVVVIIELEGKRAHPELGYFARQALRLLDDLRVGNGRLDEPVAVGDLGGTVRVELNHTDAAVLPAGFRPSGRVTDNDTTILAVARNLEVEGHEVTLVSKDLPMRVKASAVGLRARGVPRHAPWSSPASPAWPRSVSAARCSTTLFETERVDLAEARDLPCHTGLVMVSDRGSALGRVTPEKQVRLVRGDRDAFGLHGRSAEQRVALDILLDPDVGIISLGGRAGTGKSALALCAGLEAVMEKRQHRKVVVFRPLYAVGGQDLGYLPGSESEKMNPWAQAVFDTLGALVTGDVVDEIMDRGMLEVLPLTHIRGRSLHDAFVIVDEAQSLGAQRPAHGPVARRSGLARGADPRRRAARQPARRPARRCRVGDRGAQGASAVRARHADPLGAFTDRRAGHRAARGPAGLRGCPSPVPRRAWCCQGGFGERVLGPPSVADPVCPVASSGRRRLASSGQESPLGAGPTWTFRMVGRASARGRLLACSDMPTCDDPSQLASSRGGRRESRAPRTADDHLRRPGRSDWYHLRRVSCRQHLQRAAAVSHP